ncbi:MAG: ABC transporter permease [Desulfococcaceae bacterium]
MIDKKSHVPESAANSEANSRTWYGLYGTAIFVILWTVIGYAVFSRPGYRQFSGFLPIPALKALFGLVTDADFWFSVGASLRRVVIGILFAFIMGVPSGLLIGFYKKVKMFTYTPIQFLRMISPLSWMPIALLVFQSFESAIWFLIAMATVWPIIINTVHGVSGVDIHWINMARNQGAKDYQLLMKIIIPASTPFIITSIRLALGVAWIVLVPAEFLGISSGLGYLINDARDTMAYDRLMALVIAIGLIGFVLDGAIGLFQKKYSGTLFLG